MNGQKHVHVLIRHSCGCPQSVHFPFISTSFPVWSQLSIKVCVHPSNLHMFNSHLCWWRSPVCLQSGSRPWCQLSRGSRWFRVLYPEVCLQSLWPPATASSAKNQTKKYIIIQIKKLESTDKRGQSFPKWLLFACRLKKDITYNQLGIINK